VDKTTDQEKLMEDVINIVARGQATARTEPALISIPKNPLRPELSISIVSTNDIIQAVDERPNDHSSEIVNKCIVKLKRSTYGSHCYDDSRGNCQSDQ